MNLFWDNKSRRKLQKSETQQDVRSSADQVPSLHVVPFCGHMQIRIVTGKAKVAARHGRRHVKLTLCSL